MRLTPSLTRSESVYLCDSSDLQDSSAGVPFEVVYRFESCHAFAVRYAGTVYAYLNRCTHVPMELDYQPNQFFDRSGDWLICATHGALFAPQTGLCRLGPCRGGLVKIEVSEADGQVHWHTSEQLQPEKSL
ncbi:Rieske 2Fe-2S domain-containing protein [Rhodoferax sp. 4810]|nr:Rieske 2Fe-2S domain-containing protein [Rhodoferax jenense]